MAAMPPGSGTEDLTTVVILVRHGESVGNREGRFGGHGATPLSDFGFRQAEATGQAIARRFRPTAITSSDLLRARQTADSISRAVGLAVEYDPGLRERSLGELDDLTFASVQERYPERWRSLMTSDPRYCPPGGETSEAVFARVSTTIDRLVSQQAGGVVVVVSHGLAIFHAFAHICGLGSPSNGLKVFALVDNCSLSTFSHCRHRWRIHSLNERAHLEALGRDDA